MHARVALGLTEYQCTRLGARVGFEELSEELLGGDLLRVGVGVRVRLRVRLRVRVESFSEGYRCGDHGSEAVVLVEADEVRPHVVVLAQVEWRLRPQEDLVRGRVRVRVKGEGGGER